MSMEGKNSVFNLDQDQEKKSIGEVSTLALVFLYFLE